MSTPVKLPELGESVTEGTITRWLKQVGDTVEVDEALLEVSTDKVDTEIPSAVAGTILEIKAEEDETVEVGAELCVIGDEGEGGGSSDDSADDSADESDDADDSADSDDSSDDEADSDDSGDDSTEEDSSPEDQSSDGESSDEGAPEETEQKPAATKSSGGGGTEVKLPELGVSVTEGTITRWLKSVGDEVVVD